MRQIEELMCYGLEINTFTAQSTDWKYQSLLCLKEDSNFGEIIVFFIDVVEVHYDESDSVIYFTPLSFYFVTQSGNHCFIRNIIFQNSQTFY